MDQQKCFADLPESARTGCVVSNQLAAEVLSIPIYPELVEAQRAEVVAAIASFVA
jgi:dTDP-4-amino-4,6-dideoxygalactose transaminase